jgi:hypothetical protein
MKRKKKSTKRKSSRKKKKASRKKKKASRKKKKASRKPTKRGRKSKIKKSRRKKSRKKSKTKHKFRILQRNESISAYINRQISLVEKSQTELSTMKSNNVDAEHAETFITDHQEILGKNFGEEKKKVEIGKIVSKMLKYYHGDLSNRISQWKKSRIRNELKKILKNILSARVEWISREFPAKDFTYRAMQRVWEQEDRAKEKADRAKEKADREKMLREEFQTNLTDLRNAGSIERLPDFKKDFMEWKRLKKQKEYGYRGERPPGPFLEWFDGILGSEASQLKRAKEKKDKERKKEQRRWDSGYYDTTVGDNGGWRRRG